MTMYIRLFVFWIYICTCLLTEEMIRNIPNSFTCLTKPKERKGSGFFRVIDFSSEYRTNRWGAKQIIGLPNVYPAYENNDKAWAPWKIDANQFLEFEFLNRVYVSKIDIYETFNAGGVKAIKCKNDLTDKWITLWSTSKVSVIKESRIFSPSFTSTAPCFSNRIRLDIDCSLADNWVQIDAVKLHGYKDPPSTPITTPSSTTTQVQTTGTTTTTRANSPTTTATSTVKLVTSPITKQSTTRAYSPTTTARSTVKLVTSPITKQLTSTTHGQTTSLSGIDGQSAASKRQSSEGGSTTTAITAGVSVTVALAVVAVVIVLVLRHKKKSCFANTERSKQNRDDDNHISLQNDLYQAPGAPVLNLTYWGLDIGNRKSKEHEASEFTDVNYQNTNNAYFVLEKDGFELQRNAANSTPTDVHDYFVLEKQQPNVGNRNGVSTNEVHPYFVLEKQGDQPVHDRPPNEANPNFVLEKQTIGNPPPIHTANALALEDTDEDTYQEIDTDDTYAGIDDSREDNNDYDYTNKAFNDSRTEISDNVYNHLNAAGDEYDHLGKGQSNDEATENNYDVTSSAV